MNTWKVILATLIIFGAGVITGGLLVSYSDRVNSDHAARPPRPQPRIAANPSGPQAPGPNAAAPRENRQPPLLPAPLRKEFVDRLERELKLTAAQRERIEKIITEAQDRTRTAWQPIVRRELVESSAQIRAELTPEQQSRFEELMRRNRDQRRPPPRERPFTNLPSDPVGDVPR